jgi:K+-sensing histidine kinase KdpD
MSRCRTTHRVRRQADVARLREGRTRTLLMLTGELASVRTCEEIVSATTRQVADVLGARTVVLLPDGDRRLLLKGDSAGVATLDAKKVAVAEWAFEHDQTAGRGTATLPAAAGTYVPMMASRGAAGVLGVFPREHGEPWSAEQRQMVEAFASQAALAKEARQAWEKVEASFSATRFRREFPTNCASFPSLVPARGRRPAHRVVRHILQCGCHSAALDMDAPESARMQYAVAAWPTTPPSFS